VVPVAEECSLSDGSPVVREAIFRLTCNTRGRDDLASSSSCLAAFKTRAGAI